MDKESQTPKKVRQREELKRSNAASPHKSKRKYQRKAKHKEEESHDE